MSLCIGQLTWSDLVHVVCSCFGELALLYSAPREVTVRAVSECKLWVMERQVYLTIKRTCADQAAALRRKLLAKAPMLELLAPVRPQPMYCHSLPPLPACACLR